MGKGADRQHGVAASKERDRRFLRGVPMDVDPRLRIIEAAKTASADAIEVSVLDTYLDAA